MLNSANKTLIDGSGCRLLSSQWWRQPISDIAKLAPIQAVDHPLFTEQCLSVDIKREDLLCPYLGGNKLYKLHYHLQRALALHSHTLATFGGAYSNHIYALARTGYEVGIKTVGVIRGEQPRFLSPTLTDAKAMGMQLYFVSRAAYREKHTFAARKQWGLDSPGVYTVPEGGGDMRGALGMAEYWRSVQAQYPRYDTVVLAAGTGASLAGIMAASQAPVSVHGLLMLKGSANLNKRYCRHVLAMAHALRYRLAPHVDANVLSRPIAWQLHTQFHQGGYGPAKGVDADAIRALSVATDIPLDPVYTGKMLSGVLSLARAGTWSRSRRVLIIHTGGLQGGRSLASVNKH